MSIGVGTALALGGLTAAGGIGSAAIGARAAGKAANAQVAAANHAADLQHQDAAAALAYQKQVDAYNRGIQAPFIATGTAANKVQAYLMGLTPNYQDPKLIQPLAPGSTVDDKQIFSDAYNRAVAQYGAKAIQQNPALLDSFRQQAQEEYNKQVAAEQATQQTPQAAADTGTPALGPGGDFGSLAKGFDEKFVAPTADDLTKDPGYQARIRLGSQALERSAAARGNVLSGGTLKDLMSFNSDMGSQEYGAAYNRTMNEYLTRENTFNTNQANEFNRYSALSGTGQVSANQVGLLGESGARTVAGIYGTEGQQVGSSILDAGSARASGYLARGGAINSGINNSLASLLDIYSISKYGQRRPTSKPFNVNVPYGGGTGVYE